MTWVNNQIKNINLDKRNYVVIKLINKIYQTITVYVKLN